MMSDSEIDLIINVDSTVVSTPLTTSQLSTIIRKRKQTSDVWNYFSLSDERAVCNRCKSCFTYKQDGTTGTSSLRRHLKSCGPSNINDHHSAMVYDSYSNSFMTTSTDFNQVSSTKALVELIVAKDLPFMFVEYSGLNVFLKGLNPDFKLITANTVKSTMFKYFEKAKVVVQNLILLPGNGMFSATSDLWTSEHQNIGYICFTLHWINAEFELMHLLIGFEEMSQPHSGLNLANVMNRILLDWQIPPQMMLRIVMDNASNNKTCIDEMVLQNGVHYLLGGTLLHGHCAAHLINLIANVAIHSLALIGANKQYILQWNDILRLLDRYRRTSYCSILCWL